MIIPSMLRTLFLLLVLPLNLLSQVADLRPTVILVSLDGFRPDYLDRGITPNLSALAAGGVRAKKMQPVFPSKTFPNHYSQVTGLLPSNSGIISNDMNDRETGRWFKISDANEVTSGHWWRGEPIWATAVKQGQRSACYFWPGSEAEIAGVRPTHFTKYDGRVPRAKRVEKVLEWLDMPAAERPTMITLYFSDTDGAGHRYGPFAPEVNSAIADVDSAVGLLMTGLATRGLGDKVNIIVVSDHGMAELDSNRVVFWDDVQKAAGLTIVDEGPILTLDMPEDSIEPVSARLRALKHLKIFTWDELQEKFGITPSPRTPMLWAQADEGWMVLRRSRVNRPVTGGTHGYDNRFESMQATFVADGPAFKSGYTVDRVRAIDLYELMCTILSLKPARNDGSLDSIKVVLGEKL